MIKTLLLFVALGLSTFVHAADLPKNEKIWNTRTHAWLTIQEWREREIAAGDVLVIGEEHAVDGNLSEKIHHANQVRLMAAIAEAHPLSLGMEFFDYPRQNLVDRYVDGTLPEEHFLNVIGWGGNAWPLYREQVLLPKSNGGRTWALNVPRKLSGKVGREGPGSLTEEEKALVPPLWEQGSVPYFERFRDVMSGHVTEERIVNFFWAQSLWDDAMAWQTELNRKPGEVFVIIAGLFHVDFGHALPARLRIRNLPSVKTLMQAEVKDWNPDTLSAAVAPDAKYGEHADYILVYELPAE